MKAFLSVIRPFAFTSGIFLFIWPFCLPTGLGAQTLGDALNTNLIWTTGGRLNYGLDPSWFPQTNTTRGGLAAQSAGPLYSDNNFPQESWIETTLTNPGTLFFSWKAELYGWTLAPSTYQGGKLELYLNGNLNRSTIGTDWSPQVLYCDQPTNVVHWRCYVAPGYPYTSGQDKAWLDQVVFVPDPMAPQVWSQPQPAQQRVAAGATVNISVTAIGTPPLLYQWRQDGNALPGATNAILSLTNVTLGQSGAYSVVITNSSSWVISSNATLQVVPSLPLNWIGEWPGYETSATEAVAINGNRAYIGNVYGNTYAAFLVLDISDPAHPYLLGKLTGTTADFNDMRVVGNYVFAARSDGFSVIDVSDPAQPQQVARLNLGQVKNLQIAGHYAYMISYNSGLTVVDISDPIHPSIASTIQPICFEQGVAVVGNFAYVVGRCGGNLAVLDVSTPTNPVVVSTLGLIGPADRVEVTNNTAFINTWNGLQIVDVTDPTTPVSVTNFNANVWDLRFSNGKAYVAAGKGLLIWDLSNPQNPGSLASYPLPDYAENLELVGNLVYIANWMSGLTMIDAGNPSQPRITGNYPAAANTFDLDMVGNTAYLVQGEGGLQIMDISEPAQPVPLGRYFIPSDNGCAAVKVVGNLAYVAYNSAGLQVLDISDPLHPALKGVCTNVYAQSVDVAGNYAYVGGGFNGFQIVNVTDPTHPFQVLQTNITVSVSILKVVGHYAYLAPWYDNTLMIVDVSNPSQPVQLSVIPFSSQTWNFFITNNRLYGGSQITDISDPYHPAIVGQYNDTGYVQSVGNLAFVADGYGLGAIDFSTPPAVMVGHTNTVGWSQAVRIVGQYAFLADADHGLQVYQLPENLATPPTVVPMPTNQLAFAGDNLVLAAAATGQPPLTYQWYFNGTAISGATNGFLPFTNIQTGSAGEYSVIITNSAGAATNQTQMIVIVRPTILVGGTNVLGFNTSGQFSFSFLSQAGAQYAVQYVNSLTDTNWLVLTNFSGGDSRIRVVDPSPAYPSRFYRVLRH